VVRFYKKRKHGYHPENARSKVALKTPCTNRCSSAESERAAAAAGALHLIDDGVALHDRAGARVVAPEELVETEPVFV
jgi:hypothetical protein